MALGEHLLSVGVGFRWLVSAEVIFRNRIYSPWIFLWHVLSPDCSCQCALASWPAAREFQGLASCSSESGAYCQARKRLPLELVHECVRRTGQGVQEDLVNRLLAAISEHPTGQRPYRFEPRRRDSLYPTLTATRQQARNTRKSPAKTA